MEKYLQYLAIKGFSPETLRIRRIYIKMFLKWSRGIGVSTPGRISKRLIGHYQEHLFHYRKKNGYSLAVSSQYSRLAPLRRWFGWLVRQGYLVHDPSLELELPRLGYQLPSVLTKDEAELVLHQPNPNTPSGVRDRALLEMLYSTGMRRSELIGLKLWNLDRERGVIAIRGGKGKKDRVVPVGARAIAWLDKYLSVVRPSFAVKPDEGVIFLTSKGKPFSPNHLSWLARRYVRAANPGRNGACHIFRHTMATLMLEGGADTRYIQAMLGHARLDTTQIYTHVSIRMLKQVHGATHPSAHLESGEEE
jgi:integrase/recombinase XerD